MPRQIDAAAEGQPIVDHNDFLMMGAANGMPVVEAEPDPPRRSPAETQRAKWIAFERVQRRVVPDQDVAAELRVASDDVGEQLVEPQGRSRPASRRGDPAGDRAAPRCPSPE